MGRVVCELLSTQFFGSIAYLMALNLPVAVRWFAYEQDSWKPNSYSLIPCLFKIYSEFLDRNGGDGIRTHDYWSWIDILQFHLGLSFHSCVFFKLMKALFWYRTIISYQSIYANMIVIRTRKSFRIGRWLDTNPNTLCDVFKLILTLDRIVNSDWININSAAMWLTSFCEGTKSFASSTLNWAPKRLPGWLKVVSCRVLILFMTNYHSEM